MRAFLVSSHLIRRPPCAMHVGARVGASKQEMGASVPLTDSQCKKALPRERDYKLADGGGLYLFVTSKGHKSWRLKYRFAGSEKRLLIGSYPDVPLRDARDRRDEAKRFLREHRDPLTEERKRKASSRAAAGTTFKSVAMRWHRAQLGRWSQVQATKVRQALERDVYPE